MPASLPFTREQFLGVFAAYHARVGPAPLVLEALALAALLLASRPSATGSRWIGGILAALWFWSGAVYHLGFFRAVNPAATLFGAAFIVQGLLLALTLGIRPGAHVGLDLATARGRVAAVIATYALLVYPLLGLALGHQYPAAPSFGLPCPTTLFTMAILLLVEGGAPWRLLLIVPLAWAVVGTIAALELGMAEDLGLAAAAVLTVASRLISTRSGRLESRAA
jgi:hypothetical protein